MTSRVSCLNGPISVLASLQLHLVAIGIVHIERRAIAISAKEFRIFLLDLNALLAQLCCRRGHVVTLHRETEVLDSLFLRLGWAVAGDEIDQLLAKTEMDQRRALVALVRTNTVYRVGGP